MLAKKGSVNTITSPKHSCLPEIIKFLSLGGTVLTIVLPTLIHFSKVISQLMTEHWSCGKFLLGDNISITSANCNQN